MKNSLPLLATIITATVSHDYLGKSEVIKGRSLAEVYLRRSFLLKKWGEEEKRARERETLKELWVFADFDTEEAELNIKECRKLLGARLESGDQITWDSFYNRLPFRNFEYEEPITFEDVCTELAVPKEQPRLEAILTYKVKLRIQAEERARELFNSILDDYEEARQKTLSEYNAERTAYEENQRETIAELDRLREEFAGNDPNAICQFVRLALVYGGYPSTVSRVFEVGFDESTRTAIIDYLLPHPTEVPDVIRYEVSADEDEIVPVTFDPEEMESSYEDLATQIALRSLYEPFNADSEGRIDKIVFNGWVWQSESSENPSGYTCILSVSTTRKKFLSLDLKKGSPIQVLRDLDHKTDMPLIRLKPVAPFIDSNPSNLDPYWSD